MYGIEKSHQDISPTLPCQPEKIKYPEEKNCPCICSMCHLMLRNQAELNTLGVWRIRSSAASRQNIIRCAAPGWENHLMTNWQMIHPELQLRHEQPLKEMSLKIGREMFTPRRKLLNLFSNRGTNCLNEYFF